MSDAIDLTKAVFHSRNVTDWPVTCELRGVEFSSTKGVAPIGSIPWGEITPAGWDGPITHSLWLGRLIGGVWHIACALEFYKGKVWTGAPLDSEYTNWFNVGKGFGELETQPNVVTGEKVAFMVTAGSQRLKDTSTQPGPKSVQERSNVIVVDFVPNGVKGVGGVFVPPPVVDPPAPTPVPVVDNKAVLDAIKALSDKLDNLTLESGPFILPLPRLLGGNVVVKNIILKVKK